MKRFNKFLTLLLAIVFTVAAFTVVSLATDEEATLSEPHVRPVTGSWEALKDGDYLGTGTRGMRRGYIYAEADINGNMYEVYMPGINKGHDSDVWYDNFGDYSASTGNFIEREYTDAEGNPATKKITKYNLGDYPYVVYDFDIMTPTGNFGAPTLSSFSFRTYAYFYTAGGGFGYGSSKNDVNKMADTGDSLLSIASSNVFGYLDATPYNWQHVTLISKAYDGNNGPAFEVYVYVDGEQMNTEPFVYENTKATFASVLLEDLGFAYIRHSASYDGNKLVDLSGFKKDDITTWPDSDPSEWYEDKTALDNPEFTHFQADWTPEAIAARNWERFEAKVPESAPRASASLTKADGSVVYFASVQAAVDAADIGEKVTVLQDFNDPIVIDKAIVLDVGMRYKKDADGSGSDTVLETYLLGEHYAPFYSTVGFAYEYADGVYTFEASSDTYTVIWDPDCEGECNCPDAVKHYFKATTKVAVGNSPACTKSAVFDTAGGLVISLEGWKTSPNGETVQLSDVSAAAGESVTLYPVWYIAQYDFEVIDSIGESTFYFAKDFEAQLIQAAKTAGTLKLHQDVYTECATVEIKSNFTLDLNGHKLMRSFVYGDVFEVTKDEATGEYVAPSTATSTVANQGTFFDVNANNIKVKIISSNGEGAIYNASMNAVVWKYNGEVVKRTASATSTGTFFNLSWKKNTTNFNLTLSGFALYTNSLWQQSSESAGNYVLNVEGCKLFRMTNSGRYIEARANTPYVINFTDTLIYGPAANNFILLGTNTNAAKYFETSHITFTNCDFAKKDASYEIGISHQRSNASQVKVSYDNCRLYDVGSSGETTATNSYYRYEKDGGQGVSKPTLAEGYEAKTVSVAFSYTVPKDFSLAIDSTDDINSINFDVETTTKKQTYDRIITKAVDVNWIGSDGSVVATEKLYPGFSELTPPTVDDVILENDLYRNIAYQWADAATDGKAITSVLGLHGKTLDFKEAYNFYAVTEIDGNIDYVASLKKAQLSLTYVGQFNTIVYLPVVEGMVAPTVDGDSVSGTVLINGVPYYTYVFTSSSTNVFDDSAKVVAYTVDGEDFTKTVTVSGLVYAELVLNNDGYAAEHESVAGMVRFVREAYESKAATDAAVAEKLAAHLGRITALIGTEGENGMSTGGIYDLPAYVSDTANANTNISDYADYIYSVSFSLYGASVRTTVTLTEEATAAGVTVESITANGVNSTVVGPQTDSEGRAYYYDYSQRAYNAVGEMNIVLSVPEENKTVTVIYSLGDYIEAVTEAYPTANIDVVKALYAFGVATREYVDSLN